MTVVSIFRETWRHKRVVLPVVLLTLVAAVYVAILRPAEYGSNSSLALIPPPPAPTSSQIASDRSLAKVDANNPYAAYGDLTIVVSLVQEAMANKSIVDHLRSEGVADGYAIQTSLPPVAGEMPPPVFDITGVGPTAGAAVRAAGILDQQVIATLDQLQESQGVNRRYFVTAQLLSPPGTAETELSARAASLLAVLILGVVTLFVALSIRRAAAERSVVPNGGQAAGSEVNAPSETKARDVPRASTSTSVKPAGRRSRAAKGQRASS